MRSFLDLVKRFHSDERGVFAVIFGILAIVLVATAGAVVDYTSMETARTKAQLALDAAVLGLAPDMYSGSTEAELIEQAEALVIERVNDATVTINVTQAIIDIPNGKLRLVGSVTVPMAFVQLVGIETLQANLTAEATRSSVNIEVAVALDNTGSMKNYIDDLKVGLDGLIDIVVNDVQEPTFSKMALAPYAAALNVGDYAADIRGAIAPAIPITDFVWSGPLVDVILATKANPVVVTTDTDHGFQNGDIVYISGVKGMTQLNGKFYKVSNKTNTTIALQTTAGSNVNGTGYNTFTGAGNNNNDKVRKCLYWMEDSSNCNVQVNATAHGFETGDYIRINDASSSTYRNKYYTITKRGDDAFTLDSINSTSATYPLATGGNAYCTEYMCEYYRFTNSSGNLNTPYRITTCVTERATNTYTEDPPSTTLLGPNYTSNGACDLDQTITPLTTDKEVLHAEAAKMDDHGNTAGHIGTAWAWYLLSPDWGYLWDDPESIPVAYDHENLLKVAILMTDGVYNQQYCEGISSGSINCSAPDTATNQARALCTAMKAAGIIVYTVGFNVSGSSAGTTMTMCASDASKAFLPESGEELIEDFAEIGQDITELRLSM